MMIDFDDDLQAELEEAAERRAGRLRLASAVTFVCVWGDCIIYGGWPGLWLGWISALLLVIVVRLIVGAEPPLDG